MSPSFKRLFDFVRTATASSKHPVIDKASLARAMNVSDQTVSNWASRGVSKQGAIAAQQLFGISVVFVMDGAGLPTGGLEGGTLTNGKAIIALDADDALPDGIVLIKESLVKFAGGDGHVVPMYEEVEESLPATYKRAWFVQEGMNPAKVRRFLVSGRSMEPLLFAGDTILVNLAETDVRDGHVYAIRYGDELRVKQLHRRLDGGLILHSYNPEFPREELPPELVREHVGVIGRVREKAGKGGL